MRNQAQPGFTQKLRLLPIAQQVGARAPVGGHGYREHAVGIIGADHPHVRRLVPSQHRQPLSQPRIEHLALRIARHVVSHQRFARAAAQCHVVQIHLGRSKQFFLCTRGHIQPHQRQLVAPPVGQRPGFAPFIVQAKDVQRVPATALCDGQPAAGLRAWALDQDLVALDLRAGTQLPGSVHAPPRDVAGVGGQQHRGAARGVHAVQVEHLLVAQIGGDDEVGGALHHLSQMHNRALRGHQFTQIRIGDIHTPHVNAGVLVAGRVCGDAEPATVGTEPHGTRTDAD
ncbi:MAG: hypothetical protein KKE41_14275, partial [Gammaproteobacteria bacterium]|nr:hypothetical protein [Gammaproteobacteria bacterium]